MRYSLELARPVLMRTPLVLYAMLGDLPEEWTRHGEAPGAWSPHQVVAHLTHIEESDWLDRTRVILEHGTDRAFDPVDREAGFDRFEGVSLDDLIGRFSDVRSTNLLLLEGLVRGLDLSRRGTHPDFGQVRLDQLLATWVVHDFNHIGQIVKTMAKQYTDAVGPWRAYLPILDAP